MRIALPPRPAKFPLVEYRVICVKRVLAEIGPCRVDALITALSEVLDQSVRERTVYRALSTLEERGEVAKYADEPDGRATLWAVK